VDVAPLGGDEVAEFVDEDDEARPITTLSVSIGSSQMQTAAIAATVKTSDIAFSRNQPFTAVTSAPWSG